MCVPKPPKVPKPLPAPTPVDAQINADAEAKKLAARRGYAAMIRTGPGGAKDYNRNSQAAGLVGGTAQRLGANQ